MAGLEQSQRPFILSAVDHEILLVVAQLHYLTAEQVQRLRYSPGAINYVRERLKSLTDRGDIVQYPCSFPAMNRGYAPGKPC